MKSHHRRRRRRVAALALAACAALAASAGPVPADDHRQPASAKIGDTPADFAHPVASAPKSGDTPVDHPGASRAPRYTAPTTIQVVRPERTIVRNVDEGPACRRVDRGAAARRRRRRLPARRTHSAQASGQQPLRPR